MSSGDPQRRAGWQVFRPPGTRVHHFIVGTMSLCGRYGFYSDKLMPYDPAAAKQTDDCAECYRRAAKRHQKASTT